MAEIISDALKKKRKIRKIIITATSIVLVIALFVGMIAISSASQIESKNPERPDLIPGNGASAVDLSSNEYTTISSNENVEFLFNYNTTDIKIVNKKTKYVWSSEETVDGQTSRGRIFEILFTDKSGTDNYKYSESDSITDGKFLVYHLGENGESISAPIGDPSVKGVKVQYGIGDVGYEIKFPMALSPERYQNILQRYADLEWGGDVEIANEYLSGIYYRYNLSGEEDPLAEDIPEEDVEMYKQNYPKAKDGAWYYYADDTKYATVLEYNQMFEAFGYTEEELAEDNDGVNIPTIDVTEFTFSICYMLNEKGGLQVTIPEQEIYYNKYYPLESLKVLPNLMKFDNTNDGYFLLPDGSGSIMEFNNGKESLRDEAVYVQMYGVDSSRVVDEKTTYYNNAIFPVFGTTVFGKGAKAKSPKNNNGVFGIIESGDAFAGISATTYEQESGKYNNLALEFRINERVKMDGFGNSGNSDKDSKYCKYQFERFLGDISFSLYFFDGEDATYSGMASFYSDYLFDGEEDSTTPKEYYSTVEMVGTINVVEKFLGIEYNAKSTLTTASQVETIASDLQKNGFGNMNIKLSGWCNGGWEHGFIKKIKAEKQFGTKDEIVSLSKNLTGKGINLYPDIDIQNAYESEGKPKEEFRAATLNGSNARISDYSPVDYTREDSLSKFALSAAGLKENYNNFMESYSEYGINNVSFRNLGNEITANYRKDEGYTERQGTYQNLINVAKDTNKKGYSIMGTGGQAALVRYMDVVNNMPVESAHYDKCDYSIPFTAMVLSGHVDYTYQSINLSNNNAKDLLKLIESGAGAYYTLTGTSYPELATTSYSSLYSTVYDEIKGVRIDSKDYNKEVHQNSVLGTYSYLQNALKDVYGVTIVGHEKVADNVFKTTYANGISIYVNYSDEAVKVKGGTVGATSYLQVKEGNR